MNTQKNLGTWIIGFCFSIVSALVLGLVVVWINIEQVDMAYNLKKMRMELNNAQRLTAKLEVKRDNLISPYRLSKQAEQMGMRPPEAGQQRKLVLSE